MEEIVPLFGIPQQGQKCFSERDSDSGASSHFTLRVKYFSQ